MIPNDFIFALVSTVLLLIYRLINVPNKEVNVALAIVLSFSTSIAWCQIYIPPTSTLFIIIFIIAFSFLGVMLVFFTWHESIYIENENTFNPTIYTPDTLIGMTGTIELGYGNNSYLGQLNDPSNTKIVVYLEEDKVNTGDTFVIKSIDGNKIVATLAPHN